uniref:Uncharacterized protein n=1 Tax=Ralstonia solanacearum TaxID=305 RepID=A0A0S4V1G4_RALSL|nr:protein of unknown function [Ralstonia solanacearum]
METLMKRIGKAAAEDWHEVL